VEDGSKGAKMCVNKHNSQLRSLDRVDPSKNCSSAWLDKDINNI